mgnify:CR=1 FL=1
MEKGLAQNSIFQFIPILKLILFLIEQKSAKIKSHVLFEKAWTRKINPLHTNTRTRDILKKEFYKGYIVRYTAGLNVKNPPKM